MSHPQKERTLVIIKPDGVQRNLIGEVIKRYERAGLKLVGIKMTVPKEDHVEAHYTLDPEWRRITGEKTIASYIKKGETPWTTDPLKVTEVLLTTLKKYISSGPVVAMVWEGMHAVEIVRKITGGTEPRGAADVGTIRGDFAIDSYIMADTNKRAVRNIVHASGSPKEADMEIPHWFSENEIVNYKLIADAILYDTNIEGLV
jgi:nucleoside-diphosphate kinase